MKSLKYLVALMLALTLLSFARGCGDEAEEELSEAEETEFLTFALESDAEDSQDAESEVQVDDHDSTNQKTE